MLLHGLQGFHDQKLRVIPARRADQPGPDELEQRWERFRSAG
jgi:hypothetical protein